LRYISRVFLIFVTVIPGIAGLVVFGIASLTDWDALQIAYRNYEAVAAEATGSDAAVFIAQADQNIHRINLFAEGTWTLLSAILTTIGIHGWVLSRR
jgi:hypothetical protein